MSRYIDADKLKYSLELSIKSWGRDCNSNAPVIKTAYQDVLYRLEAMQTADVVEVVRCKDCKYCEKYKDWTNREYFGCTYNGQITEILADHYCSYGERRE